MQALHVHHAKPHVRQMNLKEQTSLVGVLMPSVLFFVDLSEGLRGKHNDDCQANPKLCTHVVLHLSIMQGTHVCKRPLTEQCSLATAPWHEIYRLLSGSVSCSQAG